jgi:serine/threonine protein kinase
VGPPVMNADLRKKVEDLFQAALAQPSEKRAEFLALACPDDPQVRNEVQSLIDVTGTDSLLEGSPLSSLAEVRPTLTFGAKLGNFEILEPIGKGGMGEVYRARDLRLKREVAIKVLPVSFALNPDWVARFEREARAASALNHSNIVSVYDIGCEGGVHWIVSELIHGDSLRVLIDRGQFSERKIIEIAVHIAEGLAVAHGAGIVHRDLKPGNIMVTRDGHVKILDFGLAKQSSVAPDETVTLENLTSTGMVMGTPGYMSPEQVRGHTVDGRSDIFSLGTIIYEMSSGKRAFSGRSSVEVMNAILKDDPPQLPTSVPATLGNIIRRCLEKEPDRRFQSAADVGFILLALSGPSSAPVPAITKKASSRLKRAAVYPAALIVAAGAYWLGTHERPPESDPPLALKRLTSDSGLTTDPALSPDGKMLAYASDRSGEGKLDIWVQQVAGGPPFRLTRNNADNGQPSFSPDGSTIAFRSERDGGGVYVVSAMGGEERLIARSGYRPRFSPKSDEIAYSGGINFGQLFTVSTGKTYLVSSAGGLSRQFQPGFAEARCPVWSPDGKYILFIGGEKPSEESVNGNVVGAHWDWYVAPVNGGPAVKTGAFQAISKQKLLDTSYVVPELWVPEGNRILFAGHLGDSTNVWQVPISDKTWRIQDDPRRVTSGTSDEINPSVANGLLAFAALTEKANLWTLSIDPVTGESRGALEQLTDGLSIDSLDDISRDGKKVVFDSNRAGHPEVWIKELESRKELLLTTSREVAGMARISADGSKVGYNNYSDNHEALYVIPASGGIPEKLCDQCGHWNWSSDTKNILHVNRKDQFHTAPIFLVNTELHKEVLVLEHPTINLFMPSFSPDDRWILFNTFNPRGRGKVYIAPLQGEALIPMSNWIEVGDTGGENEDGGDAHWSADGKSVYFGSYRDGFKCLWSQHLHPESKRPIGPPHSIQHFHRTGFSLGNYGVSRDKIVLSMGQLRANIWKTSLHGPVSTRQ